MAQLVHNDYLEQFSDSGMLGGILYSALVLGSILCLPCFPVIRAEPERFAVWTGLLGWGLVSFVEFPLYIPALAWTAFALLGYLWAATGGVKSLGQKE